MQKNFPLRVAECWNSCPGRSWSLPLCRNSKAAWVHSYCHLQMTLPSHRVRLDDLHKCQPWQFCDSVTEIREGKQTLILNGEEKWIRCSFFLSFYQQWKRLINPWLNAVHCKSWSDIALYIQREALKARGHLLSALLCLTFHSRCRRVQGHLPGVGKGRAVRGSLGR